MSDPIAKLLLPFSQSPRGPLVRDQAATVPTGSPTISGPALDSS